MKMIAISEFKAHALKIIDRLSETKESIVITKRGKPLVQVIPYQQSKRGVKPGKLADTLVFEKDILSPLGSDDWEAAQ